MDDHVVVLAGGTGGAKLARGLLDLCGDRLTVIANTGDDVVVHGGHVSPDPDLCTFWLADTIDDRGWGLEGDTFTAMGELRAAGEDVWFNLGDRDLQICRDRAAALAGGARLTDCLLELGAGYGVPARVLPMCDEPVATTIVSEGREIGLQEFLIREQGAAPISGVRFAGIDRAQCTPEVVAAIAGADTIIIGPSNPVISIGPILAVPGLRSALEDAAAPVIAVSPIVGGRVLKGPTAACMTWAGRTVNASGIASHYGALLDGLISDEPAPLVTVPHLCSDTDLSTPDARRSVATDVLAFAEGLR